MKKLYLKLALTIFLLFGATLSSQASLIVSGDGTETCVNGTPLVAGSCSIQTITPHNAWQTISPLGNGALWISYANTGIGGDTLAPPSGTDVVFSVLESFYVSAGSKLSLDVWADDTAEVFIGGTSVYSPNFTQSTCANGPIGCQPNENGHIDYTFSSAGLFDLKFDVYQVGTGTTVDSNPFGLLYSGTLTSVPEPSIIALFGLGLAGLGFAACRRRQS